MDKDRKAEQILHWVPKGRKRRGSRCIGFLREEGEDHRRTGQRRLKNDFRGLEISWERAEELVMDRVEWRRCVVRSADMHRMG